MKKRISTFLLAIIIATSLCISSGVNTMAAVSWPSFSSSKPIKTYTISTSNNTTAYTSSSLSTKKGTIYATDEIYIYSIGKNSNSKYYAYCSYPITGGRKYAYIPLSAVTSATAPISKGTATAGITAYRRASTSKTAGSISKGDVVYKMATSGSYTQVLYNIGSVSNPTGYRLAWITSSAYSKYISSPSSDTSVTTSLQYPLKNAKCSWRSYNSSTWSWSENRNGGGYSSSRVYHLGLDLTSSTSSNVYACASGTVAACSSSNSGANGRYVIVKHSISGKTVYSFYAHLSSVKVSKGQSVNTNTVLGVIGGSGYGQNNYYGTHLHFAMMDTLWSNGAYYGYAYYFTGNKKTYDGVTYYNPKYVIENKKLP
ncbi:MAG: M23 family metallopeptidase [Acutalibacteraceae bacterium]